MVGVLAGQAEEAQRHLTKESKVRRAESANVRKDGRQVHGPDTKPGGEGGAILVYGSGRDPAPSGVTARVGIVWAVRRERGKNGPVGPGHPVELTAQHRTADDEMVGAPGMVRPQVSVGFVGAGKVGERERSSEER